VATDVNRCGEPANNGSASSRFQLKNKVHTNERTNEGFKENEASAGFAVKRDVLERLLG
jgi:hypothetical protein